MRWNEWRPHLHFYVITREHAVPLHAHLILHAHPQCCTLCLNSTVRSHAQAKKEMETLAFYRVKHQYVVKIKCPPKSQHRALFEPNSHT